MKAWITLGRVISVALAFLVTVSVVPTKQLIVPTNAWADGFPSNPTLLTTTISSPYGTGSDYSYSLSSQDLTRLTNAGAPPAVNMTYTFDAGDEGGGCFTVQDNVFIYLALEIGSGDIGNADRLMLLDASGHIEAWTNGTFREDTGVTAVDGDVICLIRSDSAVIIYHNYEELDLVGGGASFFETTITGAFFVRWAAYYQNDILRDIYIVGGEDSFDKVTAKNYLGEGVKLGNNVRF